VSTPIIGITADIVSAGDRLKADVGLAYAACVHRAGGIPIILPPIPDLVDAHLALCQAFVFTGGDDPRTEAFGVPTHPKANPMHPQRQAYELALLEQLQRRKDTPVLGVCLGMQLMSLVNKGRLDQHIADTRPDAARHWDGQHTIRGTPTLREGSSPITLSTGLVASKHKQAVADPGTLRVIATSDDNIIEAVDDPDRRFYVGVQWHPERTQDPALGQRLFDEFIRMAADAS
jgi:putative glutamine amidotransferase